MIFSPASLSVLSEPLILLEAIDRPRIRIPFVEILDFRCHLRGSRMLFLAHCTARAQKPGMDWRPELLQAKHHTDQSQDSQDGDQKRHYRRQGIGNFNVLRSKLVHGRYVFDRGQQYHHETEADHDQPELPSAQQAAGPRNLLCSAKLLKELVDAKAERYES